jgi:predicted nucleic acid-binding protein
VSAVFDASVVVKWFVDDPLADAAIEARRTHAQAVAPDLMLIEVANVFRRYVVRGELQSSSAAENLSIIPQVLDLVDHRGLISEAFTLACDLNHSMTDCLYAVMARRRGLPLITADLKLAQKLGKVEGMDVCLLSSPETVA